MADDDDKIVDIGARRTDRDDARAERLVQDALGAARANGLDDDATIIEIASPDDEGVRAEPEVGARLAAVTAGIMAAAADLVSALHDQGLVDIAKLKTDLLRSQQRRLDLDDPDAAAALSELMAALDPD